MELDQDNFRYLQIKFVLFAINKFVTKKLKKIFQEQYKISKDSSKHDRQIFVEKHFPKFEKTFKDFQVKKLKTFQISEWDFELLLEGFKKCPNDQITYEFKHSIEKLIQIKEELDHYTQPSICKQKANEIENEMQTIIRNLELNKEQKEYIQELKQYSKQFEGGNYKSSHKKKKRKKSKNQFGQTYEQEILELKRQLSNNPAIFQLENEIASLKIKLQNKEYDYYILEDKFKDYQQNQDKIRIKSYVQRIEELKFTCKNLQEEIEQQEQKIRQTQEQNSKQCQEYQEKIRQAQKQNSKQCQKYQQKLRQTQEQNSKQCQEYQQKIRQIQEKKCSPKSCQYYIYQKKCDYLNDIFLEVEREQKQLKKELEIQKQIVCNIQIDRDNLYFENQKLQQQLKNESVDKTDQIKKNQQINQFDYNKFVKDFYQNTNKDLQDVQKQNKIKKFLEKSQSYLKIYQDSNKQSYLNFAFVQSQNAIALDANNFKTQLAIANCYDAKKDYSKALVHYRKSLQLNPQQQEVKDTIRKLKHKIKEQNQFCFGILD